MYVIKFLIVNINLYLNGKIKYNKDGNIDRKIRENKPLKITPEIITFIKNYVKLYPTTTLWEFSKLINDKYKVKLSDHSIYNLFFGFFFYLL